MPFMKQEFRNANIVLLTHPEFLVPPSAIGGSCMFIADIGSSYIVF